MQKLSALETPQIQNAVLLCSLFTLEQPGEKEQVSPTVPFSVRPCTGRRPAPLSCVQLET